MQQPINVIDLFAGPGGLGEGFSSLKVGGKSAFRIRMSVEKEASAHQTLTLRALYRALNSKKQRNIYSHYISGEIPKTEMIGMLSDEWTLANEETLGVPTALGLDNKKIHKQLSRLKAQFSGEPWIVIGGPPCQAYSLVGRSRNRGIEGYRPEDDHRHFLYREYLEVLNIIQPDVFVMENVKGILTSAVDGKRIFPQIRADLESPSATLNPGRRIKGKKYKIYSFVVGSDNAGLLGPQYLEDSSYVIRAELFGIPQARHRVILLGVSSEIDRQPSLLKQRSPISIEQALWGLPALRSKLSRIADSPEAWRSAINEQVKKINKKRKSNGPSRSALDCMVAQASSLNINAPIKATTYLQAGTPNDPNLKELFEWLLRDQPTILANHESRGHIAEDLCRYLFCSCWALVQRDKGSSSPKAKDFPEELRPQHKNWESGNFADRFRVQVANRPATTITSHISKDGHYFIHFDPRQCRSLSVREAARIQTFPDNYFFEGNRTQQYVQVGNAVPPLLAKQLGEIVHGLFA